MPVAGLSRTDQIVLRAFWEDKWYENSKRDLHFVSSFAFHFIDGLLRRVSTKWISEAWKWPDENLLQIILSERTI